MHTFVIKAAGINLNLNLHLKGVGQLHMQLLKLVRNVRHFSILHTRMKGTMKYNQYYESKGISFLPDCMNMCDFFCIDCNIRFPLVENLVRPARKTRWINRDLCKPYFNIIQYYVENWCMCMQAKFNCMRTYASSAIMFCPQWTIIVSGAYLKFPIKRVVTKHIILFTEEAYCYRLLYLASHDDVIKWKHFPRYWPFVWGIHWSE